MKKHEVRKIDEKVLSDMQASIFGERYRGANLARLDFPPDIQQKLMKFMDYPKNMLIFIGNAGVGKTYFLAAMLEWIHSFSPYKRIFTEIQLIEKMKRAIEMDYTVSCELDYFMGKDGVQYPNGS